MKKFISLLLSIVTLITACIGFNVTAQAAGWLSYVRSIELNTWYTESASVTDYQNPDTGRYGDAFKFVVPMNGSVKIMIQAEDKDYVYSYSNQSAIIIYKSTDLENEVYNQWLWYDDYNSSEGYYYQNLSVNLSAGTYYLRYTYKESYVNSGEYEGSYDIKLSYKPNLSKPSKFKVSTRNCTSLKLSWSKVSSASGYQLQRKSGDSWKTVATTTSTSATVKSLKAGTKYAFRVRAYKKVDGKKYYGSWKNLTTPTKPATVTLSSVSSPSKTKIKTSWKKVSGNASGYQIYYARDSKFKNVVAKTTVSGQSTTSYTGKNFTKGVKYWVKVRAYRTVDGKKYYGSWSSAKTVVSK